MDELISRNAEGYKDPTAGAALHNATWFGYMPVVYICSKHRGDVERNTLMARKYCRYAVDQGCIPIAPHLLLPQFLEEETERDKAVFMSQVLMSKCAKVWVCGSEISEDMQQEIEYARRKGKEIKRIGEEVI